MKCISRGKKMMKLFDFDDVRNMYEYVGCNTNGYYGFYFTQPVMLQRFRNKFVLPE